MNLFVYGTLCFPKRQLDVIGRIPEQMKVYLPNHGCYHLSGCAFPSIIPNGEQTSSHVNGLLLKGITESELKKLDEYEGYPSLYTRKDVVVRDYLTLSRQFTAQTYEIVDKTMVSDMWWEAPYGS